MLSILLLSVACAAAQPVGPAKSAAPSATAKDMLQAWPDGAIQTLEWFESASDLCRAMDWLRTHSERGPSASTRGVLAINIGPGLAEAFQWLGHKGGSEPGVLNLTWLAHGKGGAWWAVSAGWNDTKALDEVKLFGLASRALKLLAASESSLTDA
jgi:hypothetical protein